MFARLSCLAALSLLMAGCSSPHDASHARTHIQPDTAIKITTNGRHIDVSSGEIETQSGKIQKVQATSLLIPACPGLSYANEVFTLTPLNESDKFIWTKTPIGTKVCTTPIPDVLVPESLRVRALPGGGKTPDYKLDGKWGVIGAKKASQLPEKVLLDYTIRQRQIFTVAVDENGKVQIVPGKPYSGAPSPPQLSANLAPVANIVAPAFDGAISQSDVIMFDAPVKQGYYSQRKALARTIDKLETGKPVKICFIGDSVTCGACATEDSKTYSRLFVKSLRKKYKQAAISTIKLAKGGTFSTTQFVQLGAKIEKEHPDLIVVEFLNDLALEKVQIRKNYSEFVEAMKKNGSEIIVCLPHYPNPTLYGFKKDDWQAVANKPYYATLRELAGEENFAIADVGKRSRRIAEEGLTPELLMADYVNHPNDKGQELYAEELMRCFF